MTLSAPPIRRRRWWYARREERAIRVAKVVAVLAAVALVALGAWVVRWLVEEPGQRLAETCATGPSALGTITAAGGVDAIDSDPDVLEPYLKLPAMTDRWLGDLRYAASLGDDRDLARAAFLASRARSTAAAAEHYARIEVLCAARMAERDVDPVPRDWFVP